MRNILLLLLVSSLLITSACKKTNPNPSPTISGSYKLGDSTYTVTGYNYLGGGVNINPGGANYLFISFVTPNIPPAPGVYPIGNTNPGQASFGVTSNHYGSYIYGYSSQYLTISIPSNGYLNYSLPTTWAYLYGNHSDSLPFSMNITIPN